MSEYQAAFNTILSIEDRLAEQPKCKKALEIVRELKMRYQLHADTNNRILEPRPIIVNRPVEIVQPLIRIRDILGCAAFLAALYVVIIGLWAVTPAGSW